MLLSMLPIKGVSLGSFEELLLKYGENNDFYVIPDFDFDHLIFNFPKNINSKIISESYVLMIERLDIAHKSIGIFYVECGINIVLTSTYMMIVPLYRPAFRTFGRNLFPDPLWYCGIINKPILPKEWPETAGKTEIRSPFQILRNCSKFYLE